MSVNASLSTEAAREWSATEVRQHVQRVSASSVFAQAPVLCKLLEYLVEQTLAGKCAALKEYVVGVEVFNRGASFDPRTDTIVRVQARRLRSRLEEYYQGPGHMDGMRIEVPKGQYAASFRLVTPLAHIEWTHADPPDQPIIGVLHSALPVPHTPLIGRERDVAEVKALLLSESSRLLTLTGAGGSGKTRVAVEVARQLMHSFPGGTHYAPLAPVTDPETVTLTLAQIFGIRHTGGQPLVDALQNHLRTTLRAPALLLADNFEQVLDAGPLLVKLLESSPFLRILVTSRAVLHVYGEREYPVLTLETPDPAHSPSVARIAATASVRLFVERAAAVDPGFVLSEVNAEAVAQICARVDGLPLALELAASQTRFLSPAAIATRIENRLDLLRGGPRDVPARQQTLRKTIDWSHDLLDASEQKLFRRFAVFAGSSTLEACDAVCNTRLDLGFDLMEGVWSLVNKSLLQSCQRNGEPQFTMLETIREYALERLAESGEEPVVRRAHAAYYLVIAEEGAGDLTRVQMQTWLTLCDSEHDNLRVALEWLIAHREHEWALRLATSLYYFWDTREHLAQGRTLLLAAAKASSDRAPTKTLAKAITYAAALANSQGDYESALSEHYCALEIYRELGDKEGIAAQLCALGTTAHFRSDLEAASKWFEEALAVCREIGQPKQIAATLSNLANIVSAQGDRRLARSMLHEALSVFAASGDVVSVGWSFNHLADVAFRCGDCTEARQLYNKGLDVFRKFGDQWGIGRSCTDLGYVAIETGDASGARALFGEAVQVFVEIGHKRGIAKAIEGLSCLAASCGYYERALMIAGAAAGLRHAIGAPPRQDEQMRLNARFAATRRGCAPDAGSIAFQAGWDLPLGEAIEYALASPTPH